MKGLVVIAVLAILAKVIRLVKRPQARGLFDDDEDEFEGFSQISVLPTPDKLRTFLQLHFPFFARIWPRSQHRFLQRMYFMLKDKHFAGRDGLQVHDVMILLICATLVQLTLGIEKYKMPRFRRFVLFPDVFYSRLFDRNVKGLTVYHSGLVALSWPHAFEGHQIPDDKINLILHELAHALYLDYFGHRSERYGFSSWKEQAIPVFEKMQAIGNHPFLRDYAASNLNEFWAVCVEHFFEAPEAFRQQLPELYEAMRSILRQDPMQLKP